MALKINTNIAALNAHRSMIKNDSLLGESLERLSTGLRINKAADDSSGMAIADSLRAQALGIGQAIRNANDGISMVQTADGALQESINIINTVKTKAIQAASDGQTTATRRAIQNDIDKLLEELDAIAKTTSFNGQKLLSGAFTNKSIQIGAFANETASISIGSTEASKVGHISQADLSLASSSGGEVQLSIKSSITGETLELSAIDIQFNNNPINGMGALAGEVNRYTSVTGISAVAVVMVTTDTSIKKGTTGEDFAINGITIGAIPVEDNDSSGSLVSAINTKSAETGVEAFLTNDGKLTFRSQDGRTINFSGTVSDVMGSTSGQLSTIGYLSLTQSGVSQFQISGIGAGATGADITISGDMTTVEDSVLASGTQIVAGSMLAANSVLGGDALVESTVSNTQLDYNLKTGSTIYWGSNLSVGTILGASIITGGDLGTAGTNPTAIAQDMLVASGSKLAANSVIGKDTVVTTQFNSGGTGGTTYAVGSTLSSAVTLGSSLTLTSDMTLAYNSASNDNSAVEINSTLTSGTKLGTTFNDVGLVYSSATSGSQYTAYDVSTAVQTTAEATTATSGDIFLLDALASSNLNFTIKAGSLLADNTVLNLSTGDTTWTGPTLITDSGTIEVGDTISINTAYTLNGSQVISEDLIIYSVTAGTVTTSLASGSVLTAGFTASVNATAAGAVDVSGVGANSNITTDTATLNAEMVLKAGSELQTGSKIMSGSKIGDDTYVMGGKLNASGQTLTTYTTTLLKAGSKLENQSVLGDGSTIGGTLTVNADTTIDSDMTIQAGTLLKQGTLLKAGTLVNQDMTLNKTTSGAAATEVEVSAGDVLTTDLYLDADTTIAEEIMLKEESIIEQNSELAINTKNAGTLGLSEIETYSLAELSVLDGEGAQRAISIADSALKQLDEVRSSLGSVQNQLGSTISNLSVTKTNIQASESTIRDVDFAEESMIFSKMQLLAQTSSYALAQANASAQNVMNLLQ